MSAFREFAKMTNPRQSILGLILLSGLFLSSCANKEIVQMQESVSDLENRVFRYQKEVSQDTEETSSPLGEMNATISKAFQDIRYSQTNLETMIEQISTRLGRLEREVEALKERVGRIDTFTATSYAKLTEGLNQSRERLETDVQALQNALNTISGDLDDIQKKTDSSLARSEQTIGRVRNQLEKRMADIESNNQTMYRRILKELGASAPDLPQTSGGKIHTVVSGDTLSSIAAKHGVDMSAIQDLNGISDPSKIRIGQRIRIP